MLYRRNIFEVREIIKKKYIYWILTQIKWQLKEHSSIWYIVETFLDARTHSTATTAHKLSMHLKIEGCKLRGC
jgi:hypothetical protein